MFKIFIYWRITLFLVTFLGSLAFPLIANTGLGAIGPGKQFNFWASWAQWDGGHFISIAQNGYLKTQDFAFFPVYPALMRIISIVLNDNYLLASFLISNICTLFTLIFFHNLIKERYGKKIAFASTVTFLLYPFSFFLVASYSESLFILILILVFIFISKKKYLLSSILIIPLSLTRAIGVFAFFSVCYSYLYNISFNIKKFTPDKLLLLSSFTGLIFYSYLLKTQNNDPLLFLSAQSYWQRDVVNPLSTLFSYIMSLLVFHDRPFYDYVDLLFTILFLSILILGRKKIPSSWWIFSALAILIPASGGTLTSMPRYMLASFGAFVILGKYLHGKPNLAILFWTLSILLQAVFSIMFINGYWVA